MSKTQKAFHFPTIYSLPPFFSLQRIEETREKQSKLWCDLILKYCEHYKIYVLNVDKYENVDLFFNQKIKRKLQRDGIIYVLDDLVTKERAEWLDKKKKDLIFIYWRTPQEWADLIIKFVEENGLNNTVCTFFELLEGETGESSCFHQMDKEMFKKALKVLEKRGKAEMFQSNDNEGVKFL
ncbi:hypothetical protein ABK040_008351 [Willaertia magna]